MNNILPRAMQRCGNCDAYVATTNDQNQGECVARSPQPVVVNLPNPASKVNPQAPPFVQAVQGIFPATNKNRWCRQWSAKTEGSA